MEHDEKLERVFAFASFEVIEQTQEVRKNGIRIRLAGQPFQILLYLLCHPGEIVTRSELQDQLWGAGTYVDFDHSLNVAINKIRHALGDTADKPRFIETVTSKGYRFIGTLHRITSSSEPPVEAIDKQLSSQTTAIPAARVSPKRHRRLWLIGLPTIALGVAAALSWLWRWERTGREVSDQWRLSPLSINASYETTPALSPDGKVIVYSADPGLLGRVDLYLRHFDGGDLLRLTADGAGNQAPDFSPDGSSIAFQSNRDGGGIYRMPSLGGETELVFRGRAYNPKFSPDGTRIAFWTGAPSVALAVHGSSEAWVVAAHGGRPQRVAPALDSARNPIWFPDGKSILLAGYRSAKTLDANGVDWWKASVKGQQLARVGIYTGLVRNGLQKPNRSKDARVRTPIPWVPAPTCWAHGSDEVISSISTDDDNENVWSVGVSVTGEATGLFRRLTKGSAHEETPACGPDGMLAFASVLLKRELWSLPLRANERTTDGKPHPLVLGANEETPSLSPDGKTIAFTSDRSGRHNIWLRNLETGVETQIARSMLVQNFPVASPSSRQVAYSVYDPSGRSVFLVEPGHSAQKVCDGCTRATDWSRDERKLVTFGGTPYQINLLDVRTHEQVCLLRHSRDSLLYGRLSPDQRWLSFTIREGSRTGWIAVAPFHGDHSIPEREWRRLAQVELDDYANWSTDGRTLLFTSSEDGYPCLWALPLDSRTGGPSGNKFAVQHFHSQPGFEHGGWTVSGKQVVLSMVERTSNIWTMAR